MSKTVTLQELVDRDPEEWPKNARELIKRGLKGDEAEIALGLVTDLMDDELGEIVLGLLDDAQQSVGVRKAAADALGPILEECWEG
ncbi:MAG TPA: hypothetical protein VGO93_06550, partial [Candidatus Xenobia bacterium]